MGETRFCLKVVGQNKYHALCVGKNSFSAASTLGEIRTSKEAVPANTLYFESHYWIFLNVMSNHHEDSCTAKEQF